MVSTTLRTARAVVEGSRKPSFGTSFARSTVETMVNSAQPLPTFDGRRLSDHCIREWIGGHLDRAPEATKSTALRTLRDVGFACEQGRFGLLFSEVKGAGS